MTTKYSAAELFLTAARVAVGSPDYCHQLLSRLGEDLKEENASAAEVAVYGTAIRRNHPLIDLAIAQYSPRPAHVRNCFMRTLGRAASTLQRNYRMGLRLACLQNQRRVAGVGGNPTSYLGKSGATAFLKVATSDELMTLFTNPGIDDTLIEALYRWDKPFSDLPPPRWSSMLVYCMDNPRLQQYRGTLDKADLGHYRIQRAIWTFVERAPFNDIMGQIVLNTLVRLNPQQVYLPDSIQTALDRWGMVGLRRMSQEGHSLTGLSRQEELRCLMASLYGRKRGALSDVSATSPDIARRSCYYASAQLTPREIRAAHERDGAAFLLAAVSNVNLVLDPARSALLEQYLADDWLAHRYLRIRQSLHRDRGPVLSPEPVTEGLKARVNGGKSAPTQIPRHAPATPKAREPAPPFSGLDGLGGIARSRAFWLLVILALIAAFLWLR